MERETQHLTTSPSKLKKMLLKSKLYSRVKSRTTFRNSSSRSPKKITNIYSNQLKRSPKPSTRKSQRKFENLRKAVKQRSSFQSRSPLRKRGPQRPRRSPMLNSSRGSGSPCLNRSREERKKRIKKNLKALYKKKPKMRKISPNPSPRPYKWSPGKVRKGVLSSRETSRKGRGGRREGGSVLKKRKFKKRIIDFSHSPNNTSRRDDSQNSSRSNISNHLHNRVMRTFNNMKKSSNVPLNIKLDLFFDLDSIFWELMQPIPESHFSEISNNILNDYLIISSKLNDIHCIFRTKRVKNCIQKLRFFEEYILCFYLKLINNAYLRQIFNTKGILRYMFKNCIIMTDMVLEKGFTIYKSQNNFLKLKRLISKRKNFFEVPGRMDEAQRLKQINKNLKSIKTMLLSEFSEFEFLTEEIKGFYSEIDLIKKGEVGMQRIRSYFKLIGIRLNEISEESSKKKFEICEETEKKNLITRLEDKLKENEDRNIDERMKEPSMNEKRRKSRLKKITKKSLSPRRSKGYQSARMKMKSLKRKIHKNRSPKPSRNGGGYLPMKKDKNKKYTIVLDLDETLIHFKDTKNEGAKFLLRPNARFFISELAKNFEIIIFTAATKEYADWVLDRLDTENLISYRLYRKHTEMKEEEETIKNLEILGRDLSKVIIVDNIADNFRLQPDNGIVIKSWTGEPKDKALKQLLPLLNRRVLD